MKNDKEANFLIKFLASGDGKNRIILFFFIVFGLLCAVLGGCLGFALGIEKGGFR